MSNLKGNLESISLIDVSQLLNVNRKTGLLQITSAKGKGVLYFSNGEVIHAETATLKGEMAAYEILEWTSGTFDFQAVSVQAPSSIRRSVQDLVMDSARVSDSRKRLQRMFPRLDAIPWPKLTGDQLVSGLKFYSEDKRILPYLDGYRTFSEIMEISGQNDVAVMQTAATLLEAGRLEVLTPEATVRVGTLKTGFFKKADHLELSQSLLDTWSHMGPYREGVPNVRLIWAKGPAVERVQFVPGLDVGTIAIPKELQSAWELPEGTEVQVRPAP